MKKLIPILLAAVICCGMFQLSFAQQSTVKKFGWEMGVQTYSFRTVSFLDAADKTKALGLKYVEGYPGQDIGGGISGKLDYHMDAATRGKILKALSEKGMKMVSYGVVVPETNADWKKLFDFAKAMGLKNIVSEPHPAQMATVSKLCDEYKIDVAIHDHPRPSHYWSPDTLLAAIKGYSPRIGSCADIGHWAYSGLNVVECLKKLQGHIKEFHFKDVANTEPAKGEITAVWGTGKADIKAVMKEMRRQHFRGYVMIEYEDNPESNVQQIKESLQYFYKTAATLK